MKVGAYQPCFEIGSGGMATVYIARESGTSGLTRTVALKLMHEHLSRNDRFKKRFFDEARVLTQITHPYVCRVVGFGEDGERPFMAMEYLVGEPLSRVLKALKHRVKGVPVETRARLFARVMADIAEGMHAAHETCDAQGRPLGVVHRDVSPQNLFLLYDGTVRVLDFGIARFRDRYVETAATGQLIGKLPYMAPEQILGLPYDRRVDVWALGIVFWELVTLDRLFRRETEVRTMEAVCSDPIPRASEIASGLPEGINEILGRALQRNPELRYQTAGELAHDIELWLASTGQPVTHADLSAFLNSFFPGSQTERRRWAEEATPDAGLELAPRESQEFDFARDVMGSTGASGDSLSLPKLLPRSEDLITSEHTPTRTYGRPAPATLLPAPFVPPGMLIVGNRAAAEVSTVHESMAPATSAATHTVSIHELNTNSKSQWRQRFWALSGPALALAFGVWIGVHKPASIGDVDAFPTLAAQPLFAPAVNVAPENVAPVNVVSDQARVPVAEPIVAGRQVPPQSEAPAREVESNVAVAQELEPAPRQAPLTKQEQSQLSAPTPAPSAQRRSARRASEHGALPAAVPAPATGAVWIVSKKPGVAVYQGARLLGRTPLQTRLPLGSAQLSVRLSEQSPRSSVTATVVAGQLNIVTLK